MPAESRKSGIGVVGDLKWGTHFCYFYETKQDLLETMVPYFKTGLENKEFCLWVISEPLTEEEARSALRQAIPEFDRYLAEGTIEILPHNVWYLDTGAFDLQKVIDAWKRKLDHAVARGYAGVRISGDTGWLHKKNWRDFREYEKELSETIANQRMIALCTYPILASGAAEILDVARIHQLAIARRRGELEVVEAPELKQVKEELKRLNEELEQRVVERTRELAAINQELIREISERQRVEDELTRQKEILKKIFDQIPVMIGFLGANGRLEMANREWERILGWTLEEIQKQDLDIFAECYPDAEYRRMVLNFVAESSGEWGDFKTRVRDGRVLDTTFANVHLSDGTSIGIGQDITDRKRAEERLRATSEQLRALSASLRSAREEERARIAREIHDQLGSALTGLKWDLEGLHKGLSEVGDRSQLPPLREHLQRMTRMVDTTIHAVRRIASELRPSILDDLGLAEAVKWQAEQFQAQTGMICRRDCSAEDADLSEEQSIALFRMFQEALTNILRHAQATKVEVTLKREAGEFVMMISDNGRGISESESSAPQSLGLLGMRERTHLIGGKINISGTEGQGTVITIRVPIPG